MQVQPATVKSLVDGDYFLICKEPAAHPDLQEIINDNVRLALLSVLNQTDVKVISSLGLGHLHEFVPLQLLYAVKNALHQRLSPLMYRICHVVLRECLGFNAKFWMNSLVITRIHYPFDSSQSSGTQAFSGFSKSLGGKLFRLWRMREIVPAPVLVRSVPHFLWDAYLKHKYNFGPGRLEISKVVGVETSAVHGPHLDIWNGIPFGSLTFWWALNDIAPEAGLALYPGMSKQQFDRSIETKHGQWHSKYILPLPTKIGLSAGEVLVFSSERMFHASHLNISSKTRVVLSTHVSFFAPEFASSTRYAFRKLMISDQNGTPTHEVKAIRFRKDRCRAVCPAQTDCDPTRTPKLHRPGRLLQGTPLLACCSHELTEGEKLLIHFEDISVVVMRYLEKVYCVSSSCPHRGYSLALSEHDGPRLYCPGHGVEFDVRTGESSCKLLRVKTFRALDCDGNILVECVR